MTRIRRWQALERLIKDHGWTRGVEVGVFKGRTFKHVLSRCSGLMLWGVDRWDTAYYHATREGRPPKDFDLDAEYSALSQWVRDNAPGRGFLIREDTVKAAAMFEDNEFDFAFIDADHRYEAVKADIAAWRAKARVIVGHDYNPEEFPGVVAAVNEAFAGVVGLDDHVWMGVTRA